MTWENTANVGLVTRPRTPRAVDLTWHNPNSLVLVEGPEIVIQSVFGGFHRMLGRSSAALSTW